MASAVYQIVTDRIVHLLEQGTIPWRKPWVTGAAGHPRNLCSGKKYRGINVFLLSVTGFTSPHWLTFRQARERGGHVNKGERSTPVVFWKPWQTTRRDPATGEVAEVTIPVLRYYNLFNVEQCGGVEYPRPEQPAGSFQPIQRCERVVAGMPNPPAILHRGSQACYVPHRDQVEMPAPSAFEAPEAYYATLFHELTHATGHRSRLSRPGVANVQPFGSPDYSREELVAEMGAAFLTGHCGIEPVTIENSQAYLAGWLRRLRGDVRLVVQAGGQAQKAADYILGTPVDGGAGGPVAAACGSRRVSSPSQRRPSLLGAAAARAR